MRRAEWKPDLSKASHAGLLLNVGLENPDKKNELFEQARRAVSSAAAFYERAFARRTELFRPSGTVMIDLATAGRMVCGLGIESVLETGLRLHHTYGTPLIPGSSIKGVCANFCAEVWAKNDPAWARDQRAFKLLFGTHDDRGMLIFEDAWVTPETLPASLQEDVMTPLRPEYYQGTGDPSDSLSPIIVQFLSVKGTFQFAIRPETPSQEGQEWARLAMRLCLHALREWGIGGKTRAGYGRMKRTPAAPR